MGRSWIAIFWWFEALLFEKWFYSVLWSVQSGCSFVKTWVLWGRLFAIGVIAFGQQYMPSYPTRSHQMQFFRSTMELMAWPASNNMLHNMKSTMTLVAFLIITPLHYWLSNNHIMSFVITQEVPICGVGLYFALRATLGATNHFWFVFIIWSKQTPPRINIGVFVVVAHCLLIIWTAPHQHF